MAEMGTLHLSELNMKRKAVELLINIPVFTYGYE